MKSFNGMSPKDTIVEIKTNEQFLRENLKKWDKFK